MIKKACNSIIEHIGDIIVIAIIMILIGGFYSLFCIHSVGKHEIGFTYNRFNGEIKILNRQGWFWFWSPKYVVHTIDQRPYQIKITATLGIGDRVLNAKLVKFNPKGLDQFVAWHGRDAGDNVRPLQEIFKCYAFAPDGGASCPFIEVISETSPTGADPNGTKKEAK